MKDNFSDNFFFLLRLPIKKYYEKSPKVAFRFLIGSQHSSIYKISIIFFYSTEIYEVLYYQNSHTFFKKPVWIVCIKAQISYMKVEIKIVTEVKNVNKQNFTIKF